MMGLGVSFTGNRAQISTQQECDNNSATALFEVLRNKTLSFRRPYNGSSSSLEPAPFFRAALVAEPTKESS